METIIVDFTDDKCRALMGAPRGLLTLRYQRANTRLFTDSFSLQYE
jgi:hypothetical protein